MLSTFAYEAAGALVHRLSLRPLNGGNIVELGRNASREGFCMPFVIASVSEAIQRFFSSGLLRRLGSSQ
jgi:hypothetical protein